MIECSIMYTTVFSLDLSPYVYNFFYRVSSPYIYNRFCSCLEPVPLARPLVRPSACPPARPPRPSVRSSVRPSVRSVARQTHECYSYFACGGFAWFDHLAQNSANDCLKKLRSQHQRCSHPQQHHILNHLFPFFSEPQLHDRYNFHKVDF